MPAEIVQVEATLELAVNWPEVEADIPGSDETIGGTGSGTAATAGTITGTIAENQTGKPAGTYSKLMTLNIVY